jgi:hypothetical protein
MKVEQGITAARTIFGKCFFDSEKCADGIQALRHYRYEVEEAKSDPAGGHVALSRFPGTTGRHTAQMRFALRR